MRAPFAATESPFDSLPEALGKALVMGTGELDYGGLFEHVAASDSSWFGRVLFFVFLVAVPLALMNLLVGLAVADITDLEREGRQRALAKQASQPPPRKHTNHQLGIQYIHHFLKTKRAHRRKAEGQGKLTRQHQLDTACRL